MKKIVEITFEEHSTTGDPLKTFAAKFGQLTPEMSVHPLEVVRKSVVTDFAARFKEAMLNPVVARFSAFTVEAAKKERAILAAAERARQSDIDFMNRIADCGSVFVADEEACFVSAAPYGSDRVKRRIGFSKIECAKSTLSVAMSSSYSLACNKWPARLSSHRALLTF